MYHAFWGLAAMLVGLGLAAPAIANDLAPRLWTSNLSLMLGLTVGALGALTAISGIWRRRKPAVPWSLYPPLTVLALALLLFIGGHEERLRNQPDGAYWLLVPFGVALLLFCGLITGRRWGRFLTRWGSVLAMVGFVSLGVYQFIQMLRPHRNPPATHWEVFAFLPMLGLLALFLFFTIFYPLGRPSARQYTTRTVSDSPRVPWYQFTLKSLLLYMAILAIPLTAAVLHIRPYRVRRAALERMRTEGEILPNGIAVWFGGFDDPKTPWFNRVLYGGPPIQGVTFFDVLKRPSDEQLANANILRGIQEHILVTVQYPIEDADLKRLASALDIYDLRLTKPALTPAGWQTLEQMPLRRLWIRESSFNDDDLKHLRGLKLTDLTLVNTHVTGRGFSNLSDFDPNGPPASLGKLQLEGSPIADEGLAELKQQNIAELSLPHTNVTGAPLADWTYLKNLENLDLSYTKANDAALAFLERATKLAELRLSGCNISGEGLKGLHAREEISLQLKLNDTPLTEDDLAALAFPGFIERLSLAGTKISGIGFRKLDKGSILNLDLRRTNVNEEGLRAIAERLDGLQCLYVDPSIVPLAQRIFKDLERQTFIAPICTDEFFEP